jgi:hypothetical protein
MSTKDTFSKFSNFLSLENNSFAPTSFKPDKINDKLNYFNFYNF